MISHLKMYFKPITLKSSTAYVYHKNGTKIVCLSNRFFKLQDGKPINIDQSQALKLIMRTELYN